MIDCQTAAGRHGRSRGSTGPPGGSGWRLAVGPPTAGAVAIRPVLDPQTFIAIDRDIPAMDGDRRARERDRDLLAVLFLSASTGAGAAIARESPEVLLAPEPVDAPVVAVALTGVVAMVSLVTILAAVVLVVAALREFVRWPRGLEAAAVLAAVSVALLGFLTWIAAPYDVRGDEWIGSPVAEGELALARLLVVGVLAASLGTVWLSARWGGSSRRSIHDR